MKNSVVKRLHRAVLAAAVVFGTAGLALAGPIDAFVDSGTWLEFGFGLAGTSAFACPGCVPSGGGDSTFLDDPPWTYVSASPTTVTLTDAFQHGDTFELLDFGAVVGMTPFVIADAVGSGPDPSDPAFTSLDPLYSHASFLLAPGAHSLTIAVIDSPYDSGAAYFKVDTVAPTIPEPGTVLLLGAGLVVVAAWRKRSSA
jgi:hypothetical protein